MFFRFAISLISMILIIDTSFSQQINPILEYPSPEKTENSSSKDSIDASSFVDDNSKIDRVFIIGAGGADALKFENLTAAGSINLGFKPYKSTTLFIAANFSGNVATEEEDSTLFSSFYFADKSTSAITGSIEQNLWTITEDETPTRLMFVVEASLQNRILKSDSLTFDFSVANVNFGPKFQWQYQNEENSFVFNFGMYYNGIFLNKNSESSFSNYFNQQTSQGINYRHTTNGFGTLLTVQINNSIIYCRTFTDLARKQDLGFTVGIKTTGKIFSF